jgi:hypothetical protein
VPYRADAVVGPLSWYAHQRFDPICQVSRTRSRVVQLCIRKDCNHDSPRTWRVPRMSLCRIQGPMVCRDIVLTGNFLQRRDACIALSTIGKYYKCRSPEPSPNFLNFNRSPKRGLSTATTNSLVRLSIMRLSRIVLLLGFSQSWTRGLYR